MTRVLSFHEWKSGALPEERSAVLADARAPHRGALGLESGVLPARELRDLFEMRMLHQSCPHIAQNSVSTSRSSSWSARAVSPSKAISNWRGQLSAARARDMSSSH
jgi:hypothetical protein